MWRWISAGNLFIADHDNHRIRKVDAAGIISTVAGNGRARARTQTQGLGGDGGPATAANLDSPGGVTVDGAGNLFIAEGQRVRKVDPPGIISTVASGLRFPRAVVVDGAGNLFLAEGSRIIAERGRILKVDPSGTITTVAGYAFDLVGDGGPATSARLVNPQAVAVDGAGNVFISDVGARGMQTGVAQRIRKVDASSIITTVAGKTARRTLAATGAPRPSPAWVAPGVWRWMARATSSSPTGGTIVSGRWTQRASSPPLPETAPAVLFLGHSAGRAMTAVQPPTRACVVSAV